MHTCKGADLGGTDICGFGRLSLARHTCRVKCGAGWIYPGGDIVNEAFAVQLFLHTRTTSFALCTGLVQYRVREAEGL